LKKEKKKFKVKQEGGLQELTHSVNTIKNELEQIKTKKSTPKNQHQNQLLNKLQ